MTVLTHDISSLQYQLFAMGDPPDNLPLIDYAFNQFDGRNCFPRPGRKLQQDPFLSGFKVDQNLFQTFQLVIPQLYFIQLESPGEKCPVPHGICLDYIHKTIKAIEQFGLEETLRRTEAQIAKIQKQLMLNQTTPIQLVGMQALKVVLGDLEYLDLIAAYNHDRLVASWDLSFLSASKGWDFTQNWNHQYRRAVAWRYIQQCNIVANKFPKNTLEAAQLIMNNFDMSENLCQIAQTDVKLPQIKQIRQVLTECRTLLKAV